MSDPRPRLTNDAQGATSARPRACTEAGNAERFADQFGHRFRFCGPLGGWFEWDGARWAFGAERIKRAALEAIRTISREAASCDDDDLRTRLLKHALASERNAALNGMLEIAKALPPFAVAPAAFDADPWALNTRTGVLDLRSGALSAHDPRRMHTKLAPVAFDEAAKCPRWEAFVARILPDPEVRSFVQRFFGYACTGVVRERVLVVVYGEGRNGKSVLVRVIRHLLGDFATYTAHELLLNATGSDRHPTELADLHGVRLAALSEIKAGRSFDEAMLKRLTGNEPVKARRMHRDFFEFEMMAKLVVATNHLPEVNDDSQAIWDRIRAVPFSVRIPDAEVDTALYERLVETELPGILNWCLAGCAAWQANGLGSAPAIERMTQRYRSRTDHVTRFLSERFVRDTSGFVTRGDLQTAYSAWAQAASAPDLARNAKAFASEIRRRGIEETKYAGERGWRLTPKVEGS